MITGMHGRLLLLATLLCAAPVGADEAGGKADNTRVNQRDRQEGEATADQQKNGRSDLKITQQIRKAVVADKGLSTYAHNVKIVVREGKVTLKGPVRSADEKKRVEDKAAEVVGVSNVTSEIEIASK